MLLLLTLAAPESAAAKTLQLAGSGRDPHVAVADDGTGHVVWNEARPGAPDLLHYCRLPRGAAACVSQQVFALGGEDFNGPRALYEDGRLTLVDDRCCFPGDRLTILESSNGGLTFTPPRVIASPATLTSYSPLGFDGNAINGPGLNRITTANSGSGGTYVQAASSTGAATSAAAQVDNDVPGPTADTSSPSVALLDPLTPVAAFAQLTSDRVFVRAWAGAGEYNNIAAWAPSRPLPGKADDPRIAGGLSGAYLLYRSGKPIAQRYRVRRVTRTGFGSPIKVSAKGTPIFRDFTEDGSGHLHATWVDNGSPDRLRYSRSSNQKKFSQPNQLARGRDVFFDTAIGAAEDGGGWVLWTPASGGGGVRAAPFAPIGNGGGNQPCVPKLSYGKVVILAREGCLQKKGSRYSTPDPIRVNGLDLDPAGGGARAAAASAIVIDTGDGSLRSQGKVIARAGSVKLAEDKLAWKLPKSGGEIRDLAGNPATFETGKLNAPLLSLAVSGQTTIEIGGATSAKVPVHLKLPDPFAGLLGNTITADATLNLDNAHGLMLDDLHLRAGSIFLGIAEIKDFDVAYSQGAGDIFTGEATILLPVAKSELETKFGLAGGEFDYGRNKLTFTPPGLPVAGQFVLLQEINFNIETNPTMLSGGVVMTAGPKIPGIDLAAASVIGTVSYTFPKAPAGGIFVAKGQGLVANIPTSDVFVRYETPDLLSFGASVKVPPGGLGAPRLSGNFDGKMEIGSGKFNIEADGSADGIPGFPFGSVGVDALISNKAIAGCASITIPAVPKPKKLSGGLGYYWGGTLDPFLGCNLAPFRVQIKAHAAAGPLTFKLPKGLPQAGVRISGAGASPKVTLTGPSGQTLSSATNGSPVQGADGAIGPFPGSTDTYALLADPEPGTWTVTTNPGSAAVAGVATAEGLAEPKVRAQVRRLRGRKRRLTYEARKIAGQRITFYESGKGVFERIGAVSGTGGKGRASFSAADGPRGKRQIIATVDSFGAPRERLAVTRYKAPGPVKLGKPRHLRAKRRGNKLALSWRPLRGAKRYVVATRLRDGRRLERIVRKPKLKIGDVPGIDSAKIQVAGLKPDNTPGPTARAKLKAKPKGKHKGKGGKGKGNKGKKGHKRPTASL